MSVYGQLTDIAVSFQNSYGTPLTNSQYFIPFGDESLALKKEDIVSQNKRGIFDEGASYEGKNMVEGDIGMDAQPIPLGVFLKAMFGNPTTTLVDSVYQHVYNPDTADFDINCAKIPVTVEKHFNVGSAQQFSDLNMTNLEFSLANGELFQVKGSFVGGKYTRTAAAAASYPEGARWAFHTSSMALGGSAVDRFLDVTLTIDDSLEAQHTLNGSKYPSRIKRTGFRTVTLAGTLKFEDYTEMESFLNYTEQAFRMTLTGPTQIASGYNDTFDVQLPALLITEFEPTAGGEGPIEASFTAKGKYHVGSGNSGRFTLTNTQPAY